jgi:hypothetical protein
MPDLKPEDVKLNDIVYYTDPITLQELKFLVLNKEKLEDSNGFTCQLQLLDEPKQSVKTINSTGLNTFFARMQIHRVADNAYTFRDEFDEWPSSDVILLSKCRASPSTSTEDLEALDGYIYNRGINPAALAAADEVIKEYDKPFLHADKIRELAENALNVKERVSKRIVEAARSGEFETYLTDEEFKICLDDLVEQGYEVFSDRVSWDPEV